MKDLGGGGLSCAISEIAYSLSIGIELDVNSVHTREQDMNIDEIMISESQERMLIITDKTKLKKLEEICKKFRIKCSVIGKVTSNQIMLVKKGARTFAKLPTSVVVNAPLLDRPSTTPKYLQKIQNEKKFKPTKDLSNILLKMLSSPNLADKNWVYSQFDHEVGIRTVVKPGYDASVLRLDNGKFLAAKIDGNPKQCYLNPRDGAIGCFEEACRNVICTGARPIGMVDHLQFGNPEDPEIFWTFLESLKGLTDFAKYFKIPCVGGKVSFYNETPKGPIKPSPLIGVLGLIEKKPLLPRIISKNDLVLLIGNTKNELGGSEYFEYIHNFVGGRCPVVDFKTSKMNMNAVLELIEKNLIKVAHDCSKGGIAIAISELCMQNKIGCYIGLEKIPAEKLSEDRSLFSESHSRYLLAIERKNLKKIQSFLERKAITYDIIGKFIGDQIIFQKNSRPIIKLSVDMTRQSWMKSLGELVLHG
ncbi:MAG: Phosphoribosylformylglycinamidine synthase subunit PurL [Nitrosopumilales archaeon]|nr:MAG: Phosphoribosylformylglycinamidine synthase subunit PurL [Nitrosopumilales archaeon]